MKGSDFVKMTINIGGELIKLDVPFNQQLEVRDTEREVKNYIDRLKKTWPDNSDRNILAMAAFQFAKWAYQMVKKQEQASEIITLKKLEIDRLIHPDKSVDTDV